MPVEFELGEFVHFMYSEIVYDKNAKASRLVVTPYLGTVVESYANGQFVIADRSIIERVVRSEDGLRTFSIFDHHDSEPKRFESIAVREIL